MNSGGGASARLKLASLTIYKKDAILADFRGLDLFGCHVGIGGFDIS